MSVTLERAKEVFLEKTKAYAATNEYTIDDDESIGCMYDNLCWGGFFEQTGITQVEQWGGEGEGESYGYTITYEVDGEKIFLKFTGHYDSWNGVDWDYDTIKLVNPVQRVVTFYE